MAIELRSAEIGDMSACAAIVNEWIDQTSWMPRVHDYADVERHYRETVFAECEISVAVINTGEVAGFAALSEDDYLTALYLWANARGQGTGTLLLKNAQRNRPSGLKLWTFEANIPAQLFYERQGFRPLRRTDGDNEEKLPDILYGWEGAPQ